MAIEPTDELKLEIKDLIMSTLNITDVDPNAVSNNEPLFGGNNALTLDSVDGIEIIMALQRKYNVRLNDQNLARHIIQSIDTIAEFISRERPAA
ncbi:MAG: acyl carrier protein [Bacteroidales bacterium]|nr:acyl carrier protein [Bacteroidales bacterium]